MAPRWMNRRGDPPPPPPPPPQDQLIALERASANMMKKRPKEFTGNTDPLVAEGWICSLESIFAYMGFTDADKESAVRGVNLETLTREDFRRTFYAKYFIDDVRSQMFRDFMSLRQEDKSVVEYIRQFERGCHFVPLIAGDEREKLRQFVDGLRADIKHDVRMLDVATYDTAVTKAI
ncbi:uncharacterized protein [Henckelia pumila]|uniref:uncharacterized protein n=1 Tax=Henckelia pumila TaxID=405737 RepID=UPI003C6DBE9B